MTVIQLRPGPGAPGGTCNVCGRETGNLPRHRPHCARKHGRPALGSNITEADERLILRAGTHAIHEHLATSGERWHRNVTDLDVARLLYRIEKGAVIVPSTGGRRWVALEPIPRSSPSLTLVTNEALRLKVLTISTEKTAESAYRTFVVPAPTHARLATNPARPACRAHSSGPTRWRLLDRNHLAYVDCQACLDVPMSGIYSPDVE